MTNTTQTPNNSQAQSAELNTQTRNTIIEENNEQTSKQDTESRTVKINIINENIAESHLPDSFYINEDEEFIDGETNEEIDEDELCDYEIELKYSFTEIIEIEIIDRDEKTTFDEKDISIISDENEEWLNVYNECNREEWSYEIDIVGSFDIKKLEINSNTDIKYDGMLCKYIDCDGKLIDADFHIQTEEEYLESK
jgi:hypothetical protein